MKVKEESEKADLKLNIRKTKIMALDPITSWQIDGENVEIVSDFIFFCSKINVGDDCNHDIKIHLLLGSMCVSHSECRLFATPWTSLSIGGFSREEYWSGLPFPSPENLPNPGIEPVSPALSPPYICFPGGASDKEPSCQYKRTKVCGFDPWVRKIPWRVAWEPTLVFLPGESRIQSRLAGHNPYILRVRHD